MWDFYLWVVLQCYTGTYTEVKHSEDKLNFVYVPLNIKGPVCRI